MSDYTLYIKDRKIMTNEEMIERREYGSPLYKGVVSTNFKHGRVTEKNTRWGDYDAQPGDYEHKYNLIRSIPSSYKTFLEDHFYRMFVGYKTHEWYTGPSDDPKEIEFYNYIAYECGHPEYMVNYKKEEGVIKNSAPLVDNIIPPIIVDIIDSDGNVVSSSEAKAAEPANKEEAKESSDATAKKAEKNEGKKESSDATAKKAKKNEEAAEKVDNSDAKEDTSKMKDCADLKQIFHEVGPVSSCWVDYDRHNGFKDSNESLIGKHPGLQKLVDVCAANSMVVKLINNNGLVEADIYSKGIIAPVAIFHVDPGKIRPGYSVMLGKPRDYGSIFDMILVSFEEPYFEELIVTGNLRPEYVEDARRKMVNHQFFRHIAYNAVKNEDIAVVAANTYSLCAAMDGARLDTRFKIVKYTDPGHFTLECGKTVGLGKFVRSNSQFDGLRIDVSVDNSTITNAAYGAGADEFIRLTGNICSKKDDGPSIIKEALEKAKKETEATKSKKTESDTKKEFKKGKSKKIEVPSGR